MKRAAILSMIAIAAFIAGCGANRRDAPFTRALDVSTDAKLRDGQILFAQNCNVCHPGGSAGYGLSINGAAPAAWYIKLRVRGGFGAMPAFDEKRLSDQNLDAIADYLLKLQNL